MKFKAILTVILSVAILAAAVLVLPGCSSLVDEQTAQAARLQAEAELERAKASAARAEVDAMAERSLIRQAERDAALQRSLTLLPFALLIVGLVALSGLAAAMLARRRPQIDPSVILLLQRQDRRLQELERSTWHAIAESQRGQLAAGAGHQVIVYDGEGRVIND